MTSPFNPEILAQTACIWEVMARKVGNVHPSAHFTSTSAIDFLTSAVCIAPYLRTRDHPRVGPFVYETIMATRAVVQQNTNLGIVLLLAPLCCVNPARDLREELPAVLTGLTIQDARLVFQMIRAVNPGGLGNSSEQDVKNEPTITLLEAMKLAAERDMVARQYANDFSDVFDFGVPTFLDAFTRFGCVEAAVIDSQLRWLATYPDSLIARKNGIAIAQEVQLRAREVVRMGGIATPEGRRIGVELDKHLRSDGNKLNPGTTADLITACLFVSLRENKVQPSAPFPWRVADWL